MEEECYLLHKVGCESNGSNINSDLHKIQYFLFRHLYSCVTTCKHVCRTLPELKSCLLRKVAELIDKLSLGKAAGLDSIQTPMVYQPPSWSFT